MFREVSFKALRTKETCNVVNISECFAADLIITQPRMHVERLSSVDYSYDTPQPILHLFFDFSVGAYYV